MMTSLVSFQFLLMDQVNNLYFNHLLAALVYVLAGLLDVSYLSETSSLPVRKLQGESPKSRG